MLTGRDLIVYILQNNLEDKPVFSEDGSLLGFMTVKETAVKFDVGVETVKTWIDMGCIPYIRIGTVVYIPANTVTVTY